MWANGPLLRDQFSGIRRRTAPDPVKSSVSAWAIGSSMPSLVAQLRTNSRYACFA